MAAKRLGLDVLGLRSLAAPGAIELPLPLGGRRAQLRRSEPGGAARGDSAGDSRGLEEALRR